MKSTIAVLLMMMLLSWMMGEGECIHHVVGEGDGWESPSKVVDWAAGKIFRVGDHVWFKYSAPGGVVEVTREDFYACDLSNPIRMYTDGVDKVSLDQEGTQYFASKNVESCKNGLKLPIKVLPAMAAEAPTSSSPVRLGLSSSALFSIVIIGFMY